MFDIKEGPFLKNPRLYQGFALLLTALITLPTLLVILANSQTFTVLALAYPLFTALITYDLFMSSYQSQITIGRLRKLPGVTWPFQVAKVRFWMSLGLFLLVYTQAYLLAINRQSQARFLFTPWLIIPELAAIFFILGNSTSLIDNVQPKGTTYRDTISRSWLSRQDYFVQFLGRWDQGLIVGDIPFFFKGIEKVTEEKKFTMVEGNDPDLGPYRLLLYQKRFRKFVNAFPEVQAVQTKVPEGQREAKSK